MIVVELRGKVVPKAAARFAVRGKIAMAYIPEKQRVYHEQLRYAAQQVMDGRPPLTHPLTVDIMVYLLPQKSMSYRKRLRAIKGLEYPATRPDLSNYIKMIEDALIGVVFVDDNQVVSLIACKRYAESPGVKIAVEELVHP